MESLSNDQAQALWEVGGFVIITDLPEGSEFGIDGTYHTTRKFSGIKFVPPGIHMIAWCPPPSTAPSSGPSAIPIRQAIIKYFKPKERYVLKYDKGTESVILPEGEVLMSDDNLKNLDAELAPYPFDEITGWKALTSEIAPSVVSAVVPAGIIDGLTPVMDQDDETLSKEMKDKLEEMKMRSHMEEGEMEGASLAFARFNLKRSWREGAVGEEVTRYSRDKSWLFGNVLEEQLKRDPKLLLGHLQLSFILLLHLSSFACLQAYRSIIALFTASPSLLQTPSKYLSPPKSDPNAHVGTGIKQAFQTLVDTLVSQLGALPEQVFESELPEMDVFFLDQIEALRQNLGAALWATSPSGLQVGVEEGAQWSEEERQDMNARWNRLRDVAWRRWRWDVDELGHRVEEEDEDEDGEYAPMVVEM
ncbi:hypothetical protein L202_02316 [Cryptococcus amylolentus CBS 6039]|uniref:A1 cistron-splicing factor AAR2 n=1 Tax=Cryptococcus amylolentus CBS 6039 TaxID=1295533 RepID=A0A1E3I0B2_9TREE|nr:hypothetical protein L202_02316 [Cryptococcus amylolentus CBS 6039]ODN81987.1 hypothetical protein L202_02316 [Cryptococcus amylolentus CBS 6039]